MQQVNASQKVADALTSPSQLTNFRIVSSFPKGSQILQGGLAPVIASIAVPKGYEAVPVSMSYVAGGAGYISPGDYVNVYQVVPSVVSAAGAEGSSATVPYDTPLTKLLLTKVQVLDINTQVAPLASQQTTPTTSQVVSRATTGTSIVVLLALDTADAERVIFGSQVQGLFLYLTKVDKDGNPSGPTPGADYLDQLQQEANEAYAANPK